MVFESSRISFEVVDLGKLKEGDFETSQEPSPPIVGSEAGMWSGFSRRRVATQVPDTPRLMAICFGLH